MALTVSGMSAAIKAQLDAQFPVGTGGGPARQNFCDAVATGVVNYLTANAIVTGVCPSGGGPLATGKVT
jgi:hypothetical protein